MKKCEVCRQPESDRGDIQRRQRREVSGSWRLLDFELKRSFDTLELSQAGHACKVNGDRSHSFRRHSSRAVQRTFSTSLRAALPKS